MQGWIEEGQGPYEERKEGKVRQNEGIGRLGTRWSYVKGGKTTRGKGEPGAN